MQDSLVLAMSYENAVGLAAGLFFQVLFLPLRSVRNVVGSRNHRLCQTSTATTVARQDKGKYFLLFIFKDQ